MNGIKILVAFATGIGCGIAATRTYFAKKYKDIADEEIESMRKELRRTLEYREDKKEYVDKVSYYQSSDDGSTVPPRTDYIRRKTEADIAAAQAPSEQDEPYAIDSMDYLNDGIYDKVGLTFYEGDAVLLDEAGNEVTVDETIGGNLYDIFREGNDLEMFVRNPDNGIDYDVVRDPGYYHLYDES